MIKQLAILILLSAVLFVNVNCHNQKKDNVYKGQLEIAGICMNYTIKLIEGEISPALIDTTWTDESTGKKYTNVFALKNPCQFPSKIKPGQPFNFVIDTTVQQPCNVCEAFYPTPAKALSIIIVED
jgi:hypothetical protein